MHILHLEDDGPLREILKVALEAVDPSCALIQFVSSDSADTYLTANHNSIDLYVLDIRVPGSMNGMQFAEKIRTFDSTGAIVITSAYGRPSQDFLKTNNCEWYSKPWHILETPQMLLKLAKQAPATNPPTSSATTPTESPATNPPTSSVTTPTESPATNPPTSSATTPTESPATNPPTSSVTTPTASPATNPTPSSATTPTESPAINPPASAATTPTESPATNPTPSSATTPTESPAMNPTIPSDKKSTE